MQKKKVQTDAERNKELNHTSRNAFLQAVSKNRLNGHRQGYAFFNFTDLIKS